jgi:hypothetical protein
VMRALRICVLPALGHLVRRNHLRVGGRPTGVCGVAQQPLHDTALRKTGVVLVPQPGGFEKRMYPGSRTGRRAGTNTPN